MPTKPWTKMTADELAKATAEFDKPGAAVRAVKPPAAELAKHRRAMRKTPQRRRGRPALGDGAARVLFTIDPDLLTRLDAFASARGMKRSRLIALSVELYMGAKPGRDKRDAHAGHATVNSVPGSKSTSLAAMAG